MLKEVIKELYSLKSVLFNSINLDNFVEYYEDGTKNRIYYKYDNGKYLVLKSDGPISNLPKINQKIKLYKEIEKNKTKV